MTARARLAAAGTAAFGVSLLAGIPAAMAVSWLLPESMHASGVSGTLWRGSASAITASRLQLTDAHWSLSPLRLLLGRLSADVEARLGDGAAHGTLAVGLGGGVRCTDCGYQGSLAALRALVPAIGKLEGNLDLALGAFETRDRWPVRAVATARLSNVPIGGAAPAAGAPAATFEAQVNADPVPDTGLIEAAIRDGGGPLELTARLSVRPPGAFELSGRARARPGAPPDVVNALAALGRPGSDGSTELSVSGTF